jgi:hypothetical protein
MVVDQATHDRAQTILEAIVWATDGDDIPTVIELVFLANDDNWRAAGGDPDAIASRWALRRELAGAGLITAGAPCGHCGRPAWTANADGMPMHACCDRLPPDVPCIACRESAWRAATRRPAS